MKEQLVWPISYPAAHTSQRLDRAGLHGDLDLAARFEELARTVASALDAAAPRGPAAPVWIGLDRQPLRESTYPLPALRASGGAGRYHRCVSGRAR